MNQCGCKHRKRCLKVEVFLEEMSTNKRPQLKVHPVLLKGGNLYSNASLLGKDINIITESINGIESNVEWCNNIKVTFGVLCCSSHEAYEYLYVEEGQVLVINGEKVLVRKIKDSNI